MLLYFKTTLWGIGFLIGSVMGHAAAAEQAGCVMPDWGMYLEASPQEPTLVEEIKTESGVILAFRFDRLAGEYAKIFLFLLDGETCFRRAVSFGSYGFTNTYAQEKGDVGPDGRLYHGDLYEPGSHATLGFFKIPPTYEAARKIAISTLE